MYVTIYLLAICFHGTRTQSSRHMIANNCVSHQTRQVIEGDLSIVFRVHFMVPSLRGACHLNDQDDTVTCCAYFLLTMTHSDNAYSYLGYVHLSFWRDKYTSYYHCSLFDYLDPTVRLHVIIILLHVYLVLFLSDSGSCRYCCMVVGRWVDFIWSYPYWACNFNGTQIWILCNDIPRSKLQDEWYPMGTTCITECCVYYIDCFIRFIVFYVTILLFFNVPDIWVWIDPFMSMKLLLLPLCLVDVGPGTGFPDKAIGWFRNKTSNADVEVEWLTTMKIPQMSPIKM